MASTLVKETASSQIPKNSWNKSSYFDATEHIHMAVFGSSTIIKNQRLCNFRVIVTHRRHRSLLCLVRSFGRAALANYLQNWQMDMQLDSLCRSMAKHEKLRIIAQSGHSLVKQSIHFSMIQQSTINGESMRFCFTAYGLIMIVCCILLCLYCHGYHKVNMKF